MKSPKQIERFIRDSFELFHFDYDDFFKPYWNSTTEVSWVNEDGNVNTNAVIFASMILGLSEKTILNTEYDILFARVNKYPFIKYKNIYYENYLLKKNYKNDISYSDIFWTRVFDDDACSNEKNIKRYSVDNIKHRLEDTIKDIDKHLPGTYHKNAEILNLNIVADSFFHFAEGETFVKSFIDMYDSLINLFFKAFDGNLTQEEINEYNFLVTCFGFRLLYDSKTYNYYDNISVIKAIPNITKEKLKSYFQFTKINDFEPWKCSEFINNKELVQTYFDRFPQFKAEMRRFAVDVTKIRCYFNWSDGNKIESQQQLDNYLCELEKEQLTDEEYEFLFTRYNSSERTKIYVDKTPEELADDEDTSKIILSYCRPERLGGIKTKSILPNNIMLTWSPDTLLYLSHNLKKKNYYDYYEMETGPDYSYEDVFSALDIQDDDFLDSISDEEDGGSDND